METSSSQTTGLLGSEINETDSLEVILGNASPSSSDKEEILPVVPLNARLDINGHHWQGRKLQAKSEGNSEPFGGLTRCELSKWKCGCSNRAESNKTEKTVHPGGQID